MKRYLELLMTSMESTKTTTKSRRGGGHGWEQSTLAVLGGLQLDHLLLFELRLEVLESNDNTWMLPERYRDLTGEARLPGTGSWPPRPPGCSGRRVPPGGTTSFC